METKAKNYTHDIIMNDELAGHVSADGYLFKGDFVISMLTDFATKEVEAERERIVGIIQERINELQDANNNIDTIQVAWMRQSMIKELESLLTKIKE